MSEDFGNDIVSVSDEEGNDFSLEHLDTIEIDDKCYMVFHPLDIDTNINEDDEYSVVILEATEDDELIEIEDENLSEDIYNLFMERLFDDEEIDEV